MTVQQYINFLRRAGVTLEEWSVFVDVFDKVERLDGREWRFGPTDRPSELCG